MYRKSFVSEGSKRVGSIRARQLMQQVLANLGKESQWRLWAWSFKFKKGLANWTAADPYINDQLFLSKT